MKSFVNLLLFLLMMVTMYTLPWESNDWGLVHITSILSLLYSVIIVISEIIDSLSLNEEERIAGFTNFILLINSILIINWIPSWESASLLAIFVSLTFIYSLVRAIFETTSDDINI